MPEQQRFYAVGNDVFDREKPGIQSGVMSNGYAKALADGFNAGTDQPSTYLWWFTGSEVLTDWEEH